ncbi:MAG: leucine-rich repeat protein, partial [Prevotella sp.]|nr:leucine-rich repeat protein [Prevotella sp.]
RSEFANNSVWKIFKSIIQDDNITFADSNVKSVCVDNWDTNEDGELSLVEALMVTSLGQKFRGNTDIISFKELQYFRSVKTLYDDFHNCSSLVDIKFPNSVKNIGESTFQGCNKLTLADGLPEYLENIGVYAFTYCYNLGDIYIPETVTNIDFRAFRESNPLSLTVDPDNTIYDSRNNCNAIILKSEDGLWVGCSKTVIPEGVKYLNWYSFSGRKGLEYIVIPEGMEHVGNRTFLRTDLHSVTLPSTIKTIGENAFERCGYLKEIVINTSDTVAIEKDAFPEGVDGMKIYAKKGFKANNLKPLTVGLGSWATQVMYDYIKVTELVSGRDKVIAEEHFNTDAMDNWEVHGGTWEMSNGSLCQTSDSNDCMITLKNIELPAKYKYNIRAKRTGGNEGFLAVVNFENESNWQWWNVGGWQNTKHCLEYAPSGSENYIGDPVEGGIIVGDWNDIEIIVDNQYITCILNGDTVHKNVVNTKHNYWKNYTIYEHDESNVVSAKEAVGRNGGKIIVPVELKNEKEVYQFQCDVIVPEGISLDTIKASSIRANLFTERMSKVEDNHYRLVIMTPTRTLFAGNDGELFKMILSVSDDISEGDYRLRLNDIVVTDKDENRITIPYFISNLRVDNSGNVGDVNGDGYIDVVDIMGIVNHILGGSHSSFEANAADVNGDGYIDVVDIMGLVNKILGNDSSSAKFLRYQMREAE